VNRIAAQRLRNQHITRPFRGDAAALVAWLGAVQAQEYGPARWALGLRLASRPRDTHIARAVDEGRILRTHVMRPTWHFVAPADIRWMLDLTAAQVHRRMATYFRQLELDRATCLRAAKVFERSLRDGRSLTRAELGARLARARMPFTGVRLALLTMYAELEQVICSGAYRGTQLTYALLAERAPEASGRKRDEALAELTRRYFTSHAPATVRDFVWWSGLSTPDAKRGLEMAGARAATIDDVTYWSIGGASPAPAGRRRVHLLPIYDEYVVAYRDRGAVGLGSLSMAWSPRTGVTFQHALVIDGQVAGTWKTPGRRGGTVQVYPFRRLTKADQRAIEAAIQRYTRFL
jgi:hypothetical protein